MIKNSFCTGDKSLKALFNSLISLEPNPSSKLSYNNCLGTILDLLRQGESLRMLISHHLWDKEDFSHYRISNIKFCIQRYMLTFFQDIANNDNEKVLFKELNRIYSCFEIAEVNQLLDLADSFDEFWKKYSEDARVKPIINFYIKDSLCEPNK